MIISIKSLWKLSSFHWYSLESFVPSYKITVSASELMASWYFSSFQYGLSPDFSMVDPETPKFTTSYSFGSKILASIAGYDI